MGLGGKGGGDTWREKVFDGCMVVSKRQIGVEEKQVENRKKVDL